MTDQTKYLDLDAVDPDFPEIVIKLKGAEHRLQPITVKAFVENTKKVQKMALKSDTESETKIIIGMLVQTFPTMTEEMLWDLPLTKLNKILEFAQQHNGQAAVTKAAEAEAPANPPVAAS